MLSNQNNLILNFNRYIWKNIIMKHYFIMIAAIAVCLACDNNRLMINGETVEMRENPEGISAGNPRFSWKLSCSGNDIVQTAWQIKVAGSETDLERGRNLIWDSGKIESDQSHLVEYKGPGLEAGSRYYWQVTSWTNDGSIAEGDISHWSTALEAQDWKAQWIGTADSLDLTITDWHTTLPARYIRKEFQLAGKPERAMLYVSGVGSSYCHINGSQVGEDVFGPAPTWYDKTVPYLTYDVTGMLHKGGNAIGVTLGNGRFLSMRIPGAGSFGVPRLIAQLEIEYEDGSHETIVSDPSWKINRKGPIRANNEFDGETYDARMELGKWTEYGYDDSSWEEAAVVKAPDGKLTTQQTPCIGTMEKIRPLSIKFLKDKYIVDMGQNMVGFPHVKLHGKAGQPVIMRFAERLTDSGDELYMVNLRGANVTDTYIPAEDGEFSWEPVFVYHGFRFMEISGVEEAPSIEDITGKVIYDKMGTTGSFESSNGILNKLHENAGRGIKGNYRGMPTDCPQRDERMAWLGDRTTGAYGESFIFGNVHLYKKWLQDIEDSQNEAGSISDVSPKYWEIYSDDPTWPAAYFYVADMVHRQFGDDSQIRRHYPSMKRWTEHMAKEHLDKGIVRKNQYGDWCMPPESPELIHSQDPARKTDGALLSTAVYYSILQLMTEFATVCGMPEDASRWSAMASDIHKAYNDEFFNQETGGYSNNTVTANLLSLRLGLVPAEHEASVFANAVERTEKEHKGHVSTGVLGIQHLMRGLTEYGAKDLAYRIATNETFPSWGYMIKNGATTIWELWNGDTAAPDMNSGNHVMLLGDLLIWMYEDLAGIANAPDSEGFKHIWMEPVFPEGLTYVKATHESPYGLISSSWDLSSGRLEWEVGVPANSSATLVLPAELGASVSGKGVRSSEERDGKLYIEVGSGNYTIKGKH